MSDARVFVAALQARCGVRLVAPMQQPVAAPRLRFVVALESLRGLTARRVP